MNPDLCFFLMVTPSPEGYLIQPLLFRVLRREFSIIVKILRMAFLAVFLSVLPFRIHMGEGVSTVICTSKTMNPVLM